MSRSGADGSTPRGAGYDSGMRNGVGIGRAPDVEIDLRAVHLPQKPQLRQRVVVELDPQIDQRERVLVHHQQGRRLDLLELAAGRLSCLQPAHQTFRQVLVGRSLEGFDHGLGHAVVAHDVADGAARSALGGIVNRYDALAVEERGAALSVDHRDLAPTNGRVSVDQGVHGLPRRPAGLQQVENLWVPRVGSVRCWVSTAPTPARAYGQREPTPMLEVVTAAPNMPVRLHMPTNENVIA